jgi:hypothetical protein
MEDQVPASKDEIQMVLDHDYDHPFNTVVIIKARVISNVINVGHLVILSLLLIHDDGDDSLFDVLMDIYIHIVVINLE